MTPKGSRLTRLVNVDGLTDASSLLNLQESECSLLMMQREVNNEVSAFHLDLF
jgi:hypothetical protein